MGLFTKRKNKKNSKRVRDLPGERLYYQSLQHGDDELSLLKQAVDLGNSHAMSGLARYYFEHNPNDEEKRHQVVELYEKAEATGSKIDSFKFAIAYQRIKEYTKSVERLKMSIDEDNNQDAYYYYARALELGRGVDQDIKKAIEYYQKVVAIGHPIDAFYRMGTYYLDGQFIPKDIEKGLEMLEMAVSQNHEAALVELAKFYYNEQDSLYKNDQKAFQYAKNGYDSFNNLECGYYYALLHHEGRGIKKDTYTAIQTLKHINSLGYIQAKNSLDSILQEWEEEYRKNHKKASSYIHSDPNKAISLFHKIKEKYHCSIYDELDKCKKRLVEMADILFDEAIKEDDFNKIRELAQIGSLKAASYFLEEIYINCCLETYTCTGEYLYDEVTFNEGITYYDGVTYYENCKDTPYEFSKDKWNAILNLYDMRAKELVNEEKYSEALDLMNCVYPYKHLLCMVSKCKLLLQKKHYERCLDVCEDIFNHPDIEKKVNAYIMLEIIQTKVDCDRLLKNS